MLPKYGMPGGKSKGAAANLARIAANAKGATVARRPPLFASHCRPKPASRSTYAEIFILSVATATRFEIGCANSPNIFSIRSVEREPSAIIVSNAVRA